MKKVFVAIVLLWAASLFAQTAPLFDQLQNALLNRDEKAFLALSLPDPEVQNDQRSFIQSVLEFPYEKGVIKLAEQSENKMVLHLFFQAKDEARFESWAIRTVGSGADVRIQKCAKINSISGLYQLKISDRPYVVHNLKYRHLDALITFEDGSIFPIEAGDQITGILFTGTARFEFAPKDPTEQQQISLFVKQPRIQTTVTSMFIRSSPDLFEQLLGPLANTRTAPNPALLERTQSESNDFDRYVFSIRIPFSDEIWFARIEDDELYCEMKTPLGSLLYQHSPSESDDVLLARKNPDQVISLYNSRGAPFEPFSENKFTVLSYKMDIRFRPTAIYLSSDTHVRLRCEKEADNIVFRLNPDLRVSQVHSEQGYLIYFQEKKTNDLHIVLNEPLQKGDEITLDFTYQGKIPPEKRSPETVDINGTTQPRLQNDVYVPPTFLYSNQSVWYPQLKSRPYSEIEASITVPDSYAAVLNGIQTGTTEKNGDATFTYKCDLPAKYFSLFVGRLDSHLRVDSLVPIDVYFLSLDKKAAQDFGKSADKILRFYSNYFGAYPYKNLALVLRPIFQPGGHAPATVAIINRVFKFFQQKLAKDPLYQPDFPDFVLAHEIAHQWWGQTVGWKTYRDQWLSEGFAQFAAWEYIRAEHGDDAWKKLAADFRNWIDKKSYAGPIILGARLGHITDDPQAYSALLYNKGAYTLNMLKYWMGEKNFRECLTEFFATYRYKKVTVEDFQAVAQKHTDQDLKRFFQQWIYGWELPEVRWSIEKEPNGAKIHFEQRQQTPYELRIPVVAVNHDGKTYEYVASVDRAQQEVKLDLPFSPKSIQIDPMLQTLMRPVK